ncbi:hypothetical protein [Acidithiobacillus ferriphilus]|uniref:hypothetical protein n=1 Tax=Acidithiobacillus ferriphilus TaxID=1689834 RepID=UPI001E2D9ECB|nr:hypothetical protein [Acidithiobacillus ferriphilus]UEP58359.1 hypothetical protein K1Y48_08405 [Acidithiobacillus ferriphilus]
MLDRAIPDLRIRSIPVGPRGYGCDLKRFLFRGAASNSRRCVDECIAKGDFGPLLTERLELLESIHALIEGASLSPSSKISWCGKVSGFIQWVDRQSGDTHLTLATAKDLFLDYADHLKQRVRIEKDLKVGSAYSVLTTLSRVLGPVLDPDVQGAHRALRDLASIPQSKSSKRSRGIHADKQRLDDTFKFGRFLGDVCAALTMEAVRGPLPIDVAVADDGQTWRLVPTQLNFDLDIDQIRWKQSRERALRVRAALPPNVDAKEARTSLINLRIRAEMLIFIAQTSMNLTQVKGLPRAKYRWQVNDENYIVRAVYKARRQGVARFMVFRSYRGHFTRYIAWLDELGLSEEDDRLFPILYRSQIPAAHSPPHFDTIHRHCRNLGIPYVGPQELRRTRVNWLLRRSRDPDLTAEMAAHTKETLLRIYEDGDLQSASQEIGAYYAKNDPALLQQRGRPVCLKGNDAAPHPLPDIPEEAPQPDCVTPEGCLWCEHFRDVLAPDYCWRLASHRHLKSLEVSLFHPPASESIHPGYLVIDRLNMKLKAIAASSVACADWVKDAEEQIREGDYHPHWANLIEIVEGLV